MTIRGLNFQILSEQEVDQIDETTFRLLEEVGIHMQHPRGIEMLRGRGCQVKGDRVLIPREVVAWGLANVERDITFRSADGSRELVLGQGQFLTHNGGSVPNFEDLHTGKPRPATVQDLVNGTRILDALPNVDVVIPLVGPQDVPGELLTIVSFETILHHTRKPIGGAPAERPSDVYYMVELAAACCGGKDAFRARPTIPIMVSPVSPLKFTKNVTGSILAVVEAGVPFFPLPAPTMGASGLITMAGVLAQQHAEVLASFVLAAAARPGATVTYCSRINPIDMRRGIASWGGPNMGIAGAWATQLAHRHGFKCDTYGLCTSAPMLDPRFAYEKFANALMPALAGAEILSGVGTIDSGMTATLAGAVIDNEMISLMRHILRSYEVNEETLGFDTMKKVILSNDIFLGKSHTVKHLRDGSLWFPEINDPAIKPDGEKQVNVAALAHDLALDIIKTHKTEPLPDAVSRQLAEIMKQAKRELIPA